MRWTIRNIREDAVEQVQDLQWDTRQTLGAIVSACIEIGLPHVRKKLEDQRDYQEFLEKLI